MLEATLETVIFTETIHFENNVHVTSNLHMVIGDVFILSSNTSQRLSQILVQVTKIQYVLTR